MDFTFAEVKKIAETLPIGYYAKRRISVGFSENEETSFYNPIEDKITFSYNNIVTALTNAEDMDKETAIRSVLYHEVSHAVLTPKFPSVPFYLNIFEDERIETLLKNYYMDTDFNGLVNAISPYNGEPIENAMQAFFILCRHRIGKKPFLDRVERIIKNYAFVNTESMWTAYSYKYDVESLYEDVTKDFSKNPQDYKDGNFENDSFAQEVSKNTVKITVDSEEEEDGITVEDKEKIDASKNAKGSEEVGNSINGKKADYENEKSENEQGENGEAEEGEEGEETEEAEADGRDGLGDRIFRKAFGNFIDNSLTEKLMNIISVFNKKNNSGNGTVGHSGILNPRYCGNDDYRFFERKLEARGNNRFGSLHLNLFIDTSGSFMNNKEVVNKLLIALRSVEKKNKNFTFDVVHCGSGEELKEKKDCLINPSGGNYVDENFPKLFRKLQKQGTYNYNIILFDGWCCPVRENIFSCVDTCTTTIISDNDNKTIFEKMKTAKVIFTKKYTEELYTNVFKALNKAFR